MFHESPFDPVEDVVAEAKEERAQLHRLLTISTPRERMLVLLTAFVMLLFGAWLFFGDVTRNLTVKGVLMASVSEQPMADASFRSVVWLNPNAAQEIKSGMSAIIEVKVDGITRRLPGSVVTLAPIDLPDWFGAIDPKAPATMRQMDIVLDKNHNLELQEALKCRIIVELGEQSPIALFALRPT